MVGANYAIYASIIFLIGYVILLVMYGKDFADTLFSFENLFILYLPIFISLLTEIYYGFVMGDDKKENEKLRRTLSKYAFVSFIIIIMIDLFFLRK